MRVKEAAEIIKVHIAERDKKAAAEGLNSTAYNLRRVGDAVNAYTEVLADDVLAGYGVDQAAARHLIRIAKSVVARQ